MGQSDFSMNTAGAVSNIWDALNLSIKRLSSGLRIQSAGDDAAGLAVRELLRSDIASARQGSRNVSDAISMVQTADGAAQTIGSNLIRMKELAAQASGGTLSEQQRSIVQSEFDQLAAENSRIAETADFNGIKLFDNAETISISLGNGKTLNFQTQSVSEISADLMSGNPAAMQTVDDAITQLSALRGGLGAMANRLDQASQVIDIGLENLLAAESRISDADLAVEAAAMTATQVQAQAVVASQAQANLLSEVVLSLVG